MYFKVHVLVALFYFNFYLTFKIPGRAMSEDLSFEHGKNITVASKLFNVL